MTLAAKQHTHAGKASQGESETDAPLSRIGWACCRTPDARKDPGPTWIQNIQLELVVFDLEAHQSAYDGRPAM